MIFLSTFVIINKKGAFMKNKIIYLGYLEDISPLKKLTDNCILVLVDDDKTHYDRDIYDAFIDKNEKKVYAGDMLLSEFADEEYYELTCLRHFYGFTFDDVIMIKESLDSKYHDYSNNQYESIESFTQQHC